MHPEIIFPIIFITIFVLFYLVGTYNKLVKYQNRIEEAWSTIDVALKRRFNLVPNLVSAIKGYGKHESDIFESKINYMKGENAVDSRLENESKITHSPAIYSQSQKHILTSKPV